MLCIKLPTYELDFLFFGVIFEEMLIRQFAKYKSVGSGDNSCIRHSFAGLLIIDLCKSELFESHSTLNC